MVGKKTLLIAAAVMVLVSPAMGAGNAPITRQATRCTGMEATDIRGPLIGRRVIRNAYMGVRVHLAIRLVTGPIEALSP
jgi:hypothetical protein